jgi:hypothetical protein
VRAVEAIAALGRRIAQIRAIGAATPGRPVVVVAQYELLPFAPAWFESMLRPAGVHLILDYDDAWHHHYARHSNRLVRAVAGNKIARIMARADAVVAGSAYLLAFAEQHAVRTRFIPTALALSDYPAVPPAESPKFVVGWLGSPATAKHLELVREPVERYLKSIGGELHIVGATPEPRAEGNTRWIPWSQETAASLLVDMHVGIMPLPDTPFEHGKCAFKLLQYMAAWRPVVASPVGENLSVVERSGAGLLATSAHEWVQALETLRVAPEQRALLGRAGRRFIENAYTHDIAGERLITLIHEVAGTVPPQH